MHEFERNYDHPQPQCGVKVLGVGYSAEWGPLSPHFRDFGYDFTKVDLQEGVESLIQNPPPIAIADQRNSKIVLESRQEHTSAIILGEGDTRRRARMLDAGADHVEGVCPSPEVLIAHMNAILRRKEKIQPSVAFRDVEVDFEKRLVTRRGERLPLTNTQLRMMQFFAKHKGEALTRSAVLHGVWGSGYINEDDLFRVHLSKLRRQLGDDEKEIIKTLGQNTYVFGYEGEIPTERLTG